MALGRENRSKILSPLADAIAAFDLTAARKLVFAQMLVDSQQSAAAQLPVLIRQRNDAAVAALEQALADDCSQVAVVYGALHMPDLMARAQAMGLQPAGVAWQTAWRVSLSGGVTPELGALPKWLRPGFALSVAAVPALLLLGAFDYGAYDVPVPQCALLTDFEGPLFGAYGEGGKSTRMKMREGRLHWSLKRWPRQLVVFGVPSKLDLGGWQTHKQCRARLVRASEQ